MVVPDSVRTICEDAFSYCVLLKSVDLGSGVQSIQDYAFEGCTSLRQLSIPPSCADISRLALYQSGIQTVELRSLGDVGDLQFAVYQYGLRKIVCASQVS